MLSNTCVWLLPPYVPYCPTHSWSLGSGRTHGDVFGTNLVVQR